LGLVKEAGEMVVILGIPDVYFEESTKLAKDAGMEFFKCCDCSPVTEGKHGYWLKTYKI
jgi:hypothetical protein